MNVWRSLDTGRRAMRSVCSVARTTAGRGALEGRVPPTTALEASGARERARSFRFSGRIRLTRPKSRICRRTLRMYHSPAGVYT